MKYDCFYKVQVTQNGKTETYHWGYFPYSWVLKDVKALYKQGADAVILEMITQKQFDKRIEKYKTGVKIKKITVQEYYPSTT